MKTEQLQQFKSSITQEVADIPLEEEAAADVATISARGRISAQKSQSAFNVPGAIDYFLEIQ